MSQDARLARLERAARAGDQGAVAKLQAERTRAQIRPPIAVKAKALDASIKTSLDLARGMLDGTLSERELLLAVALWGPQPE